MKVIVIGCTHSGTAAVKTMKALYPDLDVTVYERNDNVSFLSCGIALYVGGVIEDPKGLFYSSPEELKSLGINTLMEHEVTNIDFDSKKVSVKNLKTGETFIDHYDKLVIATGSWPIVPRIDGINSKNVLLSKNWNHSNKIIEMAKDVQNITVVGAGYIGVELAEAFSLQGKHVTLIDAEERIMPKYLDPEFTDICESAFRDHHVTLALGEKVARFEVENDVVTKVHTNKSVYDTELVIMCIGFRPNTNLVTGHLNTTPSGAILVNEYMETSREDVFACGDSATVYYNPAQEERYIPLATNAVRMGLLVGRNILKRTLRSIGTQGTSGIKIYEHCISSTGINETVAKLSNLSYQAVTVQDDNKPAFMPDHQSVTLKIIFDQETRQIIGGQILSNADVTQLMNTLSVCIQNKITVEELAVVDFFFQPHFNKPWSILNLAGIKALDQ